MCFVEAGLSCYLQTNNDETHLSERVKQIGKTVRNVKPRQLVLMPYNLNGHWMLLVFDLWKDQAMFFDPLKNKIPTDLRNLIKR